MFVVIEPDICDEISGRFPGLFGDAELGKSKSFPNPNQLVYVPQPNTIISTALSQHTTGKCKQNKCGVAP